MRFVIRTGPGSDTFDVLEGRRVNRKPLTKAKADRLAGRRTLKPAAPAAPTPPPESPLPDLRPTRAESAGGSAGFTVKGSPGGTEPWRGYTHLFE
jgi:hypothetical protein